MTVKDCRNCPSFKDSTEAGAWFRKSLGAPMCGRHGHVLGKPGLKAVQESRITTTFASTCPDFGEPCPPEPPKKLTSNVCFPNTVVMTAGSSPYGDQTRVSSCGECKYFLPADAVRADFGWSFPMCEVTGRLLFPNKLAQEARACEYRSPGMPKMSSMGMVLLPVYDEAFSAGMTPVDAFIKRKKSGAAIVDPMDYPTDKPVEPADSAAGVRAWRRVDDPEGSGKFTHLPVYRLDYFSADEQVKIPRTGDASHPEDYVDHQGLVYEVAVMWREMDMTPALMGIPGTGKTELFRHMAWLMCLPFERINIKPETSVDDLIGKTLAKDGSTYFQWGRVPKAWAKPCVLCLDEPNCNQDFWFTFRSLGDDSKQLVLDEDNGQHVDRNDDCYLGLAMNPAHDVRNAGTIPLAAADLSRMIPIETVLPPAEVEKMLVANRVQTLDGYTVPDKTMNTIMSIAQDLRKLSDDGVLAASWGIREQIQVARLTGWFSLRKCYLRALGDALEPEAREMILDVVKTYHAE